MTASAEAYKPRCAVRVVTATSLFDGHDAAINIMRRILQATGVEVIHWLCAVRLLDKSQIKY